MAIPTAAATQDKDLAEKVRQQLSRILASKSFQHVDRLQRFLSFIVDETINGRGDSLKEFPIGVDVFGKEAAFDPCMDPIVRVQARRLRTRLTRYYREEGQTDDIIIEVPKGGYAPVFRRFEGPAPKRSLAAAMVSRNTVLVLPYADHSPEKDQDYFCKGLSQEIIHALAKVETLAVVARDRIPESHEVANELNVAMIITGSIRKSRDTLRITTHLIDAVRGCYVWSDSIDRKMKNVFAIQEEIAQTILKKLRTELRAGSKTMPLDHCRADAVHLGPRQPMGIGSIGGNQNNLRAQSAILGAIDQIL